MDNLFRSEAKKIRIWFSKETITDPFEKTVALTDQNSVTIYALVTDLVTSQSQWKMPGVITNKAKEIMVEKKYRHALELSSKIKYEKDFYEGWRDNGKMQIREEGDYIRVYIYIKKVS